MARRTKGPGRSVRCEEARLAIEEWLDHELEGDRLATFEAHLESCEACQAERDALLEVQSLLHEAGATDRAESSPASAPTPVKAMPWVRPWWFGPAMAAALVLLAFLPWPRGGGLLGPEPSEREELGSGEVPSESARHGTHVADSELRTAHADLEVRPGSKKGLFAIELPSESSDVHIFWIYDTEKGIPQ